MELLLNMFDHISQVGQLPDLYDDMRGIFQLIKPPLQGWALKKLMKDHDLAAEVPAGTLERLYDGCARWGQLVHGLPGRRPRRDSAVRARRRDGI